MDIFNMLGVIASVITIQEYIKANNTITITVVIVLIVHNFAYSQNTQNANTDGGTSGLPQTNIINNINGVYNVSNDTYNIDINIHLNT